MAGRQAVGEARCFEYYYVPCWKMISEKLINRCCSFSSSARCCWYGSKGEMNRANGLNGIDVCLCIGEFITQIVKSNGNWKKKDSSRNVVWQPPSSKGHCFHQSTQCMFFVAVGCVNNTHNLLDDNEKQYVKAFQTTERKGVRESERGWKKSHDGFGFGFCSLMNREGHTWLFAYGKIHHGKG